MFKKLKEKCNYYSLLRIIIAISIAFVIACIIIFSVSEEPMSAINQLFLGPLQTKRNFFSVIETMIPLVFTGLAINVMHKSGLFSMAADGSFYMGAIVAAFIAINVKLPNIAHQALLIAAAGLVGGMISTIPALIKRVTGASELVTSLMFNYIFFYMGMFILNNFMLDESTGYKSYKFLETATLGNMVEGTRVHYGFLIMLAVVLVVYLLVEKSEYGYKLKITGENKNFAKYSGIGVSSTILTSQFIGGSIAGMGGAVEMVGIYKRFSWNTTVMYVWDGILVNLLASSKPIFIPLAAMFLSYIRVGADIMSRSTDVDSEIVAIVQAIIILFIVAERLMYKFKKRKEEREALENSDKSKKLEIVADIK